MEILDIINARIVTPVGHSAVKGSRMGELRIIPEGAIRSEEGVITFCGPMEEYRKMGPQKGEIKVLDAGGKVVLPGFVDSHSHAVFAGFRAEEFGRRLRGESYMEIMKSGGGIQCTVNATRASDEKDLIRNANWLLRRMMKMGVTTVEIKSGYGLDLDTEVKMLRVISSLGKEEGLPDVVATYLGAHAVPSEYKGREREYVDFIIGEVLPEVKELAEFCDIFTEKGVFELEESERLMTAARNMGFRLKFHADEIVQLGGAELAASLGAVSADHLLHISDRGIDALAASDTVATLLPLTAFSLKEEYAPARRLIDAGAAVALATDLNPGSCFSGSIPLTIALACIYMNMSIEETITALTLNGAAAVGRASDIGSLEIGKRADMLMLEFDDYNALPYYVGMNCVRTVIKKGQIYE